MSRREPIDVVRSRFLNQLRAAIPALEEASARQALTAAGVTDRALRGLDAHLDANPDALTSGAATCPLPLLRLIWVLREAGHTGVAAPACAHCARVTQRLRFATEQGRICEQCAEKARVRPCGRCGEHRKIAHRATATTPDLCVRCHHHTRVRQECQYCGKSRLCHRAPDGRRRCDACRRRDRACAHCDQQRPTQAHWPLGPVCKPCYQAIRDNPATCAGCGRDQVLIGRDATGAGMCGPCCGDDRDYLCASCGQPGRLHSRRRCYRCVLRTRLNDLLSGPDSHPSPQLQPVIDALAEVDTPRTVLHWLTQPAGRLLTELAAAGTTISHELLDRLPPSRSEPYVRAVLVLTGVLPPREEQLERITPWLEHLLAESPNHHATLIRPFAQWSVLRRARRNARKRGFTMAAAGFARGRILIALEFLTWLETRRRTLDQATQADIDTWLTSGSTNRYNVRYFLDWAAGRHLVTGITVPPRPAEHPTAFLDHDQHWQQLRRCITDETMPLHLRVAGTLVLLFGVRHSRIVELRAADITTVGADTYLTLGENPVLLPPAVAELLTRLAANPHHHSTLTRSLGTGPLLFPGNTAGRPLGPSHLGNELARHGIDTRAARNTALMTLAADLPAAVLAEILGLGINTAERWTRYAKRDWTSYLAARDTPPGTNTARHE